MHYQVERNSHGWLGWWEHCIKNKPAHLCESLRQHGNRSDSLSSWNGHCSESGISCIQGTCRHKERSCVRWSSGTGHGNRYMVMMGMTSGHVLPPFFYFLLEFRILETEPFLPVSLPTPNSVLRRIYSFPVLPRYDILCICHRLKCLSGQGEQHYRGCWWVWRLRPGGDYGEQARYDLSSRHLAHTSPLVTDLLTFREENAAIQIWVLSQFRC